MKNRFINNLQKMMQPFCRVKLRCLMYLLPVLFSFAGTYTTYAAASIGGKTPVCLNDTANYFIVSPTAGYAYKWGAVSSHGVSGSTAGAVLNVQWISPPSGIVKAYGIDTLTGDTMEHLTYTVTINLPPTPHLSTNYRVACQELAGKVVNFQLPPAILDTGKCMLVCSGATVTYYAHGGSGSTYAWAATGHSLIIPMADSCIVVWGSPGRGTLTCTETDALGCKASISYCFEIIEKPLAHFETWAVYSDNTNATSKSIGICLNDLLIFKDLSTATATAPIMSCYWDFGDGKYTSTASPTSVSHKYTVAGVYTAMLVVKNACGCSDTARVKITVKPSAGQYITCPSVVCEGSVVGYRVHNFGSCPIFHWIVQGGTILGAPGTYTDTITVRWDNVDSTGFGYVMFDGSPCSALCNGSAIVKVPVIQNKGKISGPKTICVNEPAIYRMPQWPTTKFYWNTTMPLAKLDTTFQWNEIVVTAKTAGTLILRVNYRNTLLGCGGVAYDTIKVIDTASIIEPARYCVGASVTWKLSVAGMLGNWILIRPDGSTSTFPASNSFTSLLTLSGNYKLAVAGNFCGIDTLRFKVNPKAPPVDYIDGPAKACAGIPTTYDGGYLLATTNNFHWAAVTGTVSTGPASSSSIVFSGPGPWEVKAWRTDKTTGCPSDTLRKTVLNTVAPIALSGDTIVCGSTRHPYEVDYTDGETYDWGVIATSDGTNYIGTVSKTKDSSKVEITWNNPHGTSELAKVWIKVRRCGVFMTDTLDVLVQGAPVITVSGPASICSGVEATFTFTSSPALTSATSYLWNFGDGKFETSSTPTYHTYNTYGSTIPRTFKVGLLINGANGCAVSVTGTTNITVNPQAVLLLADVGGSKLNHCDSPLAWYNTLGLLSSSTATGGYEWTKIPSATILGSGPSLGVSTSLWGTGSYILKAYNSYGCYSQDTIDITDDCGCDSTNRPAISLSGSLSSCAHISATGSWTPAGWGFSPSWSWKGSGTKSVVTTGSTFGADYDSAGVKRIIYKVKYTVGGDTCTTSDSIDITVPYVPYLVADFSCTGGGSHKLTLSDVSSIFPGAYTYAFYLDTWTSPIYTTTTAGSSFVVGSLVPGSSHTVSLVISSGGLYPACTLTKSIIVPYAPVASFTIPKYNPACINAVVELTNTSPGAEPDWSAHWFFGDGSDNNLWSPWKEYGSLTPSPFKTVTLVISDRYGCSDTAKDTVEVKPNTLAGDILVSATGCAGSPVSLIYDPRPGTTSPSEFNWYEQLDYLHTTAAPATTVYAAGGYWALVKNSYGCTAKTPMVPVSLSTAPEALINGPAEVCEGATITLTCPSAEFFTGTAFYSWQIDAGAWSAWSSSSSLTTSPSVGTRTYRLITRVGLTCTDTSAVHTVIVHPSPAKPVISVAMLDCDEYKVQLGASSASAGDFTWSSGDAGTPIIVNAGGPYRVWITDAYGCTSFADTNVPLDPDVFQYIFPVGCYNLCSSEAPFTLLAPRAPSWFARWDWLKSGITSLGGGPGSVSNYPVSSPGTYNLALNSGLCADTSGDLNISFSPCTSGACFGSVQYLGAIQTSAPPMCYDTLRFNITSPPGTTWMIYGAKGTLLTGTGTGTVAAMKFRYIAFPGFTPPETITVVFTNPTTGAKCKVVIPIPLTTPCANSTSKTTDDAELEGNAAVTSNDYAHLMLIPNPARDMVRLDYGFTGKDGKRSVEVYDMAGRRMFVQELPETAGSLQLALDQFSSGLYQVVLRQDGKVFLHSKLSVVK